MSEANAYLVLELRVNKRLIPLKPFLKQFVSSIVWGLVSNLKDIGAIRDIELRLTNKTRE